MRAPGGFIALNYQLIHHIPLSPDPLQQEMIHTKLVMAIPLRSPPTGESHSCTHQFYNIASYMHTLMNLPRTYNLVMKPNHSATLRIIIWYYQASRKTACSLHLNLLIKLQQLASKRYCTYCHICHIFKMVQCRGKFYSMNTIAMPYEYWSYL